MLSTHFSEKVKEKVRQENPKWTFLKCPKSKISEYFSKLLFYKTTFLGIFMFLHP